MFEYINHSLVCDACAERGLPDKCLHALKYIPPWKSYKGLQGLKKTVAKKDRAAFLEEVYGMVTTADAFFFPREIVDAEFAVLKALATVPAEIYVAIDPASHNRSSMGIAAIAYCGPEVFLLASASVPVSTANIDNVVAVIDGLVVSLQAQRNLDTATIVPIIEVNHSDVVASSLLQPFKARTGHYTMPFTSDRFKRGITPGVGVYTTTKVKQAAVIQFRTILRDHRVRVSRQLVVPSAADFNPAAPIPSPADAIDLLKDQLAAFKLHPDGSISGKTSAGHDDDQAWALLMAITWAETIRAQKK